MKNPFKTKNIVDTLVNVGIGGGANVAMDYAVENIDALKSLGETTTNLIKVGVGVLAGTMVSNKYLRAAADGIATVGASQLVKSYIAPTSGLPEGTIGAIRRRMGQRGFRNVRRVAGADFMSE